jgi:CPA2 family monovalent cation:H+ antiporter-2
VESARRLNAKLLIIARAHSDDEANYLRQLGADRVMGEREIGIGMIEAGRRPGHEV